MLNHLTKMIAVAVAVILAATVHVGAATVSVTDTGTNNYGDFNGVAVDFNESTTEADWSPDLVAGSDYFVDSVTLFNSTGGNAGNTDAWYLGVYTDGPAPGDTANANVSGFLGTSTNTVDFSTLANSAPATFNFSGITVTADATPGEGSGVLYFLLQTGTDALTEIDENNDVAVRRISGESGAFVEHLAAVLDADGPPSFEATKSNRTPHYEASVTLVPEPASLVLLGLGGLLIARRRRG